MKILFMNKARFETGQPSLPPTLENKYMLCKYYKTKSILLSVVRFLYVAKLCEYIFKAFMRKFY